MRAHPRSIVLLVLSHGLALGAGWVAVKAFATPTKPVDPANHASLDSHARKRSTRVREHGNPGNPGQELLWRLEEQLEKTQTPPELSPSATRAETARKTLDTWAEAGCPASGRGEAYVRFTHWFEIDPKNALAYWGGSGGGLLTKEESRFLEEQLATMPASKLSGWLRPPSELTSSAATEPVVAALGKLVATQGDPKTLESIMQDVPDRVRRRIGMEAIRQWPENKLSKLDGFIAKTGDATLVKAFVGRMRPEDRIQWIRNVLDQQPTLAGLIQSARMVEEVLYHATGGSIDERMKILANVAAENGKPPPPENLRSQLLSRDVADWLEQNDLAEEGNLSDWRHRMTIGKVSGREILDAAKRELPSLAASNPDALRSAVFEKLAGINPKEAMLVLSDVPIAEREKQVLKSATALASSGAPRLVGELLSLRPATLSSSANDRFQVWVTASDPGVRNYGDSYAAWIMAMPQGLDRDMALGALALRVEGADPEQAAKLREAKTLPPGWRPDKP